MSSSSAKRQVTAKPLAWWRPVTRGLTAALVAVLITMVWLAPRIVEAAGGSYFIVKTIEDAMLLANADDVAIRFQAIASVSASSVTAACIGIVGGLVVPSWPGLGRPQRLA